MSSYCGKNLVIIFLFEFVILLPIINTLVGLLLCVMYEDSLLNQYRFSLIFENSFMSLMMIQEQLGVSFAIESFAFEVC